MLFSSQATTITIKLALAVNRDANSHALTLRHAIDMFI